SFPSNEGWNGTYRYKRVEENFDRAVGFVNQTGIEDHALDVSYTHFLPRGNFLRSISGHYDSYTSVSLDDGDYISDVKTLRFAANDNTGDIFYGRYINNREFLRRDFTMYRPTDGAAPVVIPAGEYEFDEKILGAIFGNQRMLSGRIDFNWGEYFGGDRAQVMLQTNVRPS